MRKCGYSQGDTKEQVSRFGKFGSAMNIDEVFIRIGQFGPIQRLYVLTLSLMNMYHPFHVLHNAFAGAVPSFVCFPKVPGDPLRNHCPDGALESCSKMVYGKEFTSIATEWNLICDENYKAKMAQSVFMAGVMTGAFFLGGLSDKIGRLKTLLMTLVGMIIFSALSAVAPQYELFLAFRYFNGFCCQGNILAVFVLTSEIVGSSKRAVCGTLIQATFALGIILFAGLSWCIRDWRHLTLVISSMGTVYIGLYFIVPESPRWLLTAGKTIESKKVLGYIAQKNGTSLPQKWELHAPVGKTGKKIQSALDLCHHKVLCKRTLIQIYSWFVNSAVYYGLTLAASDIGSDIYTSAALSGAVEIPAYVISVLLLGWLGRRWTLCGFMVLGGVSCIGIQFVPQTNFTHNVIIMLALTGKLGIAASFATVYIHSAELFPTVIRNAGMGLVAVAARIGGIVAPFIILLGNISPNLQFVVFGALSFTAGIFNLWLPETLNQPLPETIEDLLRPEENEKYKQLPTEPYVTEKQVARVAEILEKEESSEDEVYNDNIKVAFLKAS